MLIALFEPDIPQNTGSLLRLAACTGVALHIIEPCGFPFDNKELRRVAMDYVDLASLTRHVSWNQFLVYKQEQGLRLVLLTTRATTYHTIFEFQRNDVLLFGRESSGVPQAVHDVVDASVKIPLAPGARSLNLVQAASMVVGEALKQTDLWPA